MIGRLAGSLASKLLLTSVEVEIEAADEATVSMDIAEKAETVESTSCLGMVNGVLNADEVISTSEFSASRSSEALKMVSAAFRRLEEAIAFI